MGDFQAQGFVGLGPESLIEGLSLPMNMYYAREMAGLRVGLNYENPLSTDRISTITFGYYDLSHVENGEDGLVPFQNVGEDNWTVMLRSFNYDGKSLKEKTPFRMAHIDSAGSLIQMPMTEFKELTDQLKAIDPSVRWEHRQEDEGYRLATNKKCEDISHKYGDLDFYLNETQIIIHPKGYLSPQFGDEKSCVLGIEGISDSFNEYRLGSTFLRNFYVGLDYENNNLVLGLNKGNLDASMTYPPKDDDSMSNKTIGMVGLFVLIYLVIMLVLALVCYLRSKRLKDREVVFDGPTIITDPAQTEAGQKSQPKYKNGVEIMPSEAEKIKKE